MAWIAGVDGCKGGWIAVYEDTESGELDCRVAVCKHPTGHGDDNLSCAFEVVMAHHAPLAAVAVDMPIGLRDDRDGRDCDRAAREVLGKRSSSIFSAPAEGVPISSARCRSRNAKTRVPMTVPTSGTGRGPAREREDGKGLSRQSWALVPKIAEVARYLDGHP